MKIIEVNAQEFDRLSSCEPGSNIYQSYQYAQYMNKKNCEPLFLQYIDDSNIVQAMAMFLLKKDSFFSFKLSAYCPFGFLTNYYDHELLKSFTNDLIVYFTDKKLKKIVIEPLIHLNDGKYTNKSICKIITDCGFEKTMDKYIYELDTNKSKKIKDIKNIIYKVVLLDNEQASKYYNEKTELLNIFKDHTLHYAYQLDVEKSLRELNQELSQCIDFIDENSENLKYAQDVEDTNSRILQIQKNLADLEQFKNKDKEILCVYSLIKYSDNYYIASIYNRNNTDLFDASKLLINQICKEAKKDGIESLFSEQEFYSSENMELVGEFTYNL